MTHLPDFTTVPLALPPDVEEAVTVLETSTDLAAGEAAFWTVQKFQNGFGLRFALPPSVFTVLVVIIAQTGSQRGLSDPIVIGLMAGAALLIAGFLILNHRRRRSMAIAYRRIDAALRRWRALAQSSSQKDPE